MINKHPLQFTKTAVEFDTGNLVLGRILQAISYVHPAAYLAPGALSPILSTKTRQAQETMDLIKRIESSLDPYDKEALKDLKIRFGGPKFIEDLVLRPGPEPWYQRLGGRIFASNYSLPYKLINALQYPAFYFMSPMIGPHYMAVANTINYAPTSKAVTLHELGHALDFMRELKRIKSHTGVGRYIQEYTPLAYSQTYGKESPLNIFGNTVADASLRGASTIARYITAIPAIENIPILKPHAGYIKSLVLPTEAMANKLSLQALARAYEKGNIGREEAETLLKERTKILPFGFLSYTLPAITTFASRYPYFRSQVVYDPLSEMEAMIRKSMLEATGQPIVPGDPRLKPKVLFVKPNIKILTHIVGPYLLAIAAASQLSALMQSKEERLRSLAMGAEQYNKLMQALREKTKERS